MTRLEGPTWVYQVYDAHGYLAYVGIARNLSRRLGQHRAARPCWLRLTHVVRAERYASRTEAAIAEAHAIATRYPYGNRAEYPGLASLPLPTPIESAPLVGVSRA